MATLDKIHKLYEQYMGIPPSQEDIGEMSMMTSADVEDILSNTRSDIQSQAVETAQQHIADLASALPEGSPEASQYLKTVAEGRGAVEEMYGLPEAERQAREAEEFYRQIATRGPMFEEVMRAGLTQDISPKFLGATRSDMEEYFSGIPNPLVRDQMVGAYLDAADRSLTASLNALNGLYQTALVSAETAVEMEQSHYNRIADKASDLYKELQWVGRERFQERQQMRAEQRALQQQKELMKYRAGLETEEPTKEERIATDVDKMIEQSRGEDQLISADTYLDARAEWIRGGGTENDFYAIYPPERLMGWWEIRELPRSEQPKDSFITEVWFKSEFDEESLKEEAKNAGFRRGLFRRGPAKVEDYLESQMGIVQAYRDEGFTDYDITKLLGL